MNATLQYSGQSNGDNEIACVISEQRPKDSELDPHWIFIGCDVTAAAAAAAAAASHDTISETASLK